MRILIADDSEIDQKVLASMLKRQGECQVVSSGSAVLEAIEKSYGEENPFGLLCLDIIMPDLAGHEVLQRIRNLEKAKKIAKADRLRIVMTTGLHDVKHILKATNLGCDGYVTKPVEKERLMIELSKMGLVVKWE